MRIDIINFGNIFSVEPHLSNRSDVREITRQWQRDNQTKYNTYKSRSQTAYDWLCIERE